MSVAQFFVFLVFAPSCLRDQRRPPLPRGPVYVLDSDQTPPQRGRRRLCGDRTENILFPKDNRGLANDKLKPGRMENFMTAFRDETVVFAGIHIGRVSETCVETQYALLKKFFRGPFRYIAYFDLDLSEEESMDKEMRIRDSLEAKCKTLKIVCRFFPAVAHRHPSLLFPAAPDRPLPLPSSEHLHKDIVQWAFHENLCHEGVFVILDGGMMLTAKTSARALMEGKALRYAAASRKCLDASSGQRETAKESQELCIHRDLMPALLAFDFHTLPNIDEFSLDDESPKASETSMDETANGKKCEGGGDCVESVSSRGDDEPFGLSLPNTMHAPLVTDSQVRLGFESLSSFYKHELEVFEEKWVRLLGGPERGARVLAWGPGVELLGASGGLASADVGPRGGLMTMCGGPLWGLRLGGGRGERLDALPEGPGGPGGTPLGDARTEAVESCADRGETVGVGLLEECVCGDWKVCARGDLNRGRAWGDREEEMRERECDSAPEGEIAGAEGE
uniref:Uncharacterized protein n=1 Tax=Chromera velia CCMP2878 TaxID=1169474 RepID=A0A0G4FS34_9ALVE|eukprot:Cvel_18503.t1-p1 / transcript=Cvel_18503.t1 / gene=Cvel_18503 / organism=Chromera_velia_CCMP2878 / gene_product=hypothetical protein / transcript_product=hypothetical protein / location=Cvel_scaffold1536:17976-29469(-) / protein_length=506 / sequence_SO=supercontig / SO=protein_coding / is_pseudo=false